VQKWIKRGMILSLVSLQTVQDLDPANVLRATKGDAELPITDKEVVAFGGEIDKEPENRLYSIVYALDTVDTSVVTADFALTRLSVDHNLHCLVSAQTRRTAG
jgi:hypothetical protein